MRLKKYSYICPMQSAQKHTFINTKNLQGSIFFRAFKYFLAQHSTNQLIFSLLLFCSLFSFAQEENEASLYINPNTAVFGLEHISSVHKQKLEPKEKTTLYIVENTIFNAPQDFAIVIISSKTEFCANVSKRNKVLKTQSVKTKAASVQPQTKAASVQPQSKTQVTQAPLPFSLPVEQKQTIVTAIATTTVTPTTFSKTTNKLFVFDNFFSLLNRKALSKKQKATCYNQNSKPFQIKTKHCNRPPPFCSQI